MKIKSKLNPAKAAVEVETEAETEDKAGAETEEKAEAGTEEKAEAEFKTEFGMVIMSAGI